MRPLGRRESAAEAIGFGGKPRATIVASDWRTVEKGSLRRFFSLRLPSGLMLRKCTYHTRGDSRWVGLPGKPQIYADSRHRIDPATGKRAYSAIVEVDRERREAFQEQALAAVDRLLGEEGQP